MVGRRAPRPRTLLAGLAAAAASLLLGACARLPYLAANLPALGAARIADLSWGEGPRGRFDLYLPPAKSPSRPLVVFFYGGGFTGGRRSDYRFAGAALARMGHVVAVPDYRVWPEVAFPAFIDDAARAVVAAQRVAAEHGADPRRIVLAGHSAGAYIAAMLALEPSYLAAAGGDAAQVVGLVGLAGPYDLAPNSDVLRAMFDARATPDEYRPLRRVRARGPATLLLHGAEDTVVGAFHTERLAARLRETGTPVEVFIYPERGHADMVAALSLPARRRADVLKRVEGFLGKLEGRRAL